MRPAGTPLRAAAAAGVQSATRARMRARSPPVIPAAWTRPSSTMVRTMAAARAPSEPGSMRIHSSMLDAVSESRGSKCTARTVRPLPGRRASAKAREWLTVDSQVSRKSAPNDTISSARPKSLNGTEARSKTSRCAARIGS